MEFKLSEARVRELARIEEEAGCDIRAGAGWDHEVARSIVNGPKSSSPALLFVIYQDGSQQYRWKCTSDNGKTIAESSDSYEDRAACEAKIHWLQQSTPSSRIVA